VIPAFDRAGNLPPGIHAAGWNEFKAKFGGSPRRVELMVGLREALSCLDAAGCRTVFIDGSFVTAKQAPGDFDLCWDAAGVSADLLDPVLLDFSRGRRAQKERFGGELFPADAAAEPAGTRFLDYFQRDRETGQSKGIVKIELGGLA